MNFNCVKSTRLKNALLPRIYCASFTSQGDHDTAKKQSKSQQNQSRRDFQKLKYTLGFTSVGLVFGFGAQYFLERRRGDLLAAEKLTRNPGEYMKGLPTYSMKDVSQHSLEKDVWVTYKQGVYDITKFLKKHPGGTKIMMAAGGPVEPFWLMYSVHNQPKILAMLEEYRVGNLDETEVYEETDVTDPYGKEPRRHPALKPSNIKPYNAEPPPELLVESYITPQ